MQSPGLRLARLAGIHLLAWLVALGLFAAADSWSALTGLRLAWVLSIATGILAGLATTTLVHEWFHLLGARLCAATYDIPLRVGLFVYEWSFEKNTLRQFLTMSVAGSVGGALSVALLWLSLPADTAGRTALLAAALGSFAFGSAVEWPVLRRARRSGDPFGELSKIDAGVLGRCFGIALLVGAAGFLGAYNL